MAVLSRWVTYLFLTGVAFNPQTLSPCRGITGVGTGLIPGAGGPLGHHLASPGAPPCVSLSTPAFMVMRAMVST